MSTSAPPRRNITRIVIVGAGILLAVNLVLFAGFNQDTDDATAEKPTEIEAIVPDLGAVMRPQDNVGADLRDDLTGILVIDGVTIPDDQIVGDPGLGQVIFRPGPDREFRELRPGVHEATVTYWPNNLTLEEAQAEGETATYAWVFKVG